MQGRLVAAQELTAQAREASYNWKNRFTAVRLENPVLAGEISRLKKEKQQLTDDLSSLESANADLHLELRDTRPALLFSRHTPEGKQASIIRSRFDEIVTPLKTKIVSCEAAIDHLQKVSSELKSTLKGREKEFKDLKRVDRASKETIQRLSIEIRALLNEKQDDEVESELYDDPLIDKSLLINDLELIAGLITGISSRQASFIHKVRQTYANRMRQNLGWIQEIINGAFVADCYRILQIGQDGGSVAEMETLCVSILVTDKENSKPKHVVLAASTLPADKTARSSVEAIKYLFERHKEKYTLFLQLCIDHGVDVSEFPSPEGISIKKMAQGCVGMSDNAASALATTELLIAQVRELVEEEFDEEELNNMSATERDKLVRMLKVGCFPHLRCILAKWGIIEEEAYLKPLIPAVDQQLRMEPTLNSLLFAIQKNFRGGYDHYAKGQQHEFKAYFQREYPGYVMFNTGRPGTGSRMDAKFEVAYAVAMNCKPYISFLVHSSNISTTTEDSVLSKSIMIRLGSVEFYSALICRARFWIKLFAPLRVLCNCHDLKDHNLHDMGRAMDMVEEAMLELVDDPSLLRNPEFCIFTLEDWPCLEGFYQSKKEKVKQEFLVADLEKERLYGHDDAGKGEVVEEMVLGLVECMARGVLKGLYRNASNSLTSYDGIYAYDNWEADMIEETKHSVSDNICLAESILGMADHYYRKGVFMMSTISGFTAAKHCGLFDSVPSFWTEAHTEMAIKLSKLYHERFLNQEKELVRRQEEVHHQKLMEKEERAQAKVLRESQEQISYFTIVYSFRSLTTIVLLTQALDSLGSVAKKVDFLKLFIKMYAVGFGYPISTQFSSVKDPTLGKLNDLFKRACAILRSKNLYPILDRPPARKTKLRATPADFGLTLLTVWDDFVAEYDDNVSEQVQDILDLDSKYGIRLQCDWDSLQRQYWNVPLTPMQKEFTRGRTFVDHDDDDTFTVLGLSWDTDRREYAAYYHEVDCPPTRFNGPGGRAEFSLFISDGNLRGINDWKLEWLN